MNVIDTMGTVHQPLPPSAEDVLEERVRQILDKVQKTLGHQFIIGRRWPMRVIARCSRCDQIAIAYESKGWFKKTLHVEGVPVRWACGFMINPFWPLPPPAGWSPLFSPYR